ncbi:oligosaccharide flippase family protein [Pseudarthrobacter sp. B4EP4b]|uniref:oligosaccharide flippase family protein n=1 Tax=Pseudarthrobacter sp. B4EP4b TaxID=2590664 RepID=UPI00114D9600|nr:oligosaccharide flippase family protein [Pseudarthrobacter sp. B4EP4b]
MWAKSLSIRKIFVWSKVRALLAYGLGPALGLLSGPILARALGPEGRGQFSSVMEPLTLGGAIATIGLPSAVTYFIAAGKDPRKVLIRALALGLPSAVATYALLAWYSEHVSETQNIPRGLLLTAWAFVVASALIQILRAYWQGLGTWRRLDLERFSFAILRFSAVVIVAAIGFTTVQPYVAGALVAFLLAGALLMSPNLFTRRERDVPDVKGIYRYSFAAAVGTIAVVCSNRIDQALLPIVADSEQLGFYAIAVTVAEVPVICAALAGRNALTLASRGSTLKFILKDIAPFIASGLLLLVVLYAGAPFYIPALFGTNFSPSILAVQILTVGTAFSLITFVSIAIVSGRGNPAKSSLIPLYSVLITLICFGVIGSDTNSTYAALISTASQIGGATVGAALVWSGRNRPPNGVSASPIVGKDNDLSLQVR